VLPLFSNPAIGKNDGPKATFLGHAFSDEQNYKPHFKLQMKKGVLPIYRMMLKTISSFG
jgi:hypothetical protein